MTLLEVRDLRVRFGEVEALRGVSLLLANGGSLAVVGESGAGKSTLARCLVGLLQSPEATGTVRIDGREVLGASPDVLRELRWSVVAVSLQGSPFNPVARVRDQIADPAWDRGASKVVGRVRAEEVAGEVGLETSLLDRYPHELSGGQRRLASLAMTLVLGPRLVILDEPTAGLDPVTATEVVERVRALSQRRGFALLVVSHDLYHASLLADRTIVLYAGEVLEAGDRAQVLGDPAHPYTSDLVSAYPVMSTTRDLRPIRGRAPDPRAVPSGCPYHPRCSQAEQVCVEQHPGLVTSRERLVACHFGGLRTLLTAEGVSRSFRSGRRDVEALRGVSLQLRHGEALGVVGASGSGKTTLARILTGHLPPGGGSVLLEGAPIPDSWGRRAREVRRRIQLVMQDAADALSPRLTIAQVVAEPLELAGVARHRWAGQIEEVFERMGLPGKGDFLGMRAHQLSGGQQQRVVLARALILRPKVLVADEPTSMLDASEQARLLVLLREQQSEMGLGLLLVSHDLALVRKVTDRIVVLDAGRVVEEGTSAQVTSAPSSEACRRLLAAAPSLDWREHR
jgi:peptide/nickel transport system ATP-binding protein